MLGLDLGTDIGGAGSSASSNFYMSADVGNFTVSNERPLAGSGIGTGTGIGGGQGYNNTLDVTNLVVNHYLTAEQGTFTLTGNDANLIVTGAGDVVILIDPGTFILTGNDINALVSRSLFADTGTFTLTGNDVNFNISAPQDIGTFTLNGQNADLLHHHVMSATRGVFTEIGIAANLLRASRLLVVDKKRSKFFVFGNESIDFQRGRVEIKLTKPISNIIIDRSLPHFLRSGSV